MADGDLAPHDRGAQYGHAPRPVKRWRVLVGSRGAAAVMRADTEGWDAAAADWNAAAADWNAAAATDRRVADPDDSSASDGSFD